MAVNMILFSTMYDQNSNHEDVGCDTDLHDGEKDDVEADKNNDDGGAEAEP